MAKIAVVTGGNGYVGLNLVDRLLADGYQVRALDRREHEQTREDLQWFRGDVLQPETLESLMDGADVVHHLAAKVTLAQEDPSAWAINVDGVTNVATAALRGGVSRFVHCSSMASFDIQRSGGRLVETSPRATDPSIPVYGRSKLAGEEALLRVAEQGLDAVITYPTGVLGPRDRAVLSKLNDVVLMAARGRLPILVGGALDLVDVRDVAAGMILAGDVGVSGERYFLGGYTVQLADMLRQAARLVGRAGPRVLLPMGVIRAIAPPIVKLSGSTEHPLSELSLDTVSQSAVVDYSKAVADLGYRPRPLTETISDLMGWLVSEGYLAGDR